MAIELDTTATATVTTQSQQELQCDFGWVTRLLIDASKLTLDAATVDASLRPGQSNAATTKIPTFADAIAEILIKISNLKKAYENYPDRIGPCMAAIETCIQGLAIDVRNENLAILATAQSALAAAEADVTAKTGAVKAAQDAITTAASAGQTIDASSPLVAALATAQSNLADAKVVSVTAKANVVIAQAALVDLSNPPLVI